MKELFSLAKTDHTGYESVVLGYRLDFGRGGAYVAMALILLGVGLDYSMYPKHLVEFTIARFICCIPMFIATLLMPTQWGQSRIQFLTFTWLLWPQILIAWIISATDGAHSIYYAGLSIAIFGSGVAMPLSFWQNSLLSILTLV
ncbi:MAG: hypothetical protein RL748_3693, partial [Pseudomonadota bacterium]